MDRPSYISMHNLIAFFGVGAVDGGETDAKICLRAKAPAHADPNYVNSKEPLVYSDEAGKGMRCEALLEARAEGRDRR